MSFPMSTRFYDSLIKYMFSSFKTFLLISNWDSVWDFSKFIYPQLKLWVLNRTRYEKLSAQSAYRRFKPVSSWTTSLYVSRASEVEHVLPETPQEPSASSEDWMRAECEQQRTVIECNAVNVSYRKRRHRQLHGQDLARWTSLAAPEIFRLLLWWGLIRSITSKWVKVHPRLIKGFEWKGKVSDCVLEQNWTPRMARLFHWSFTAGSFWERQGPYFQMWTEVDGNAQQQYRETRPPANKAAESALQSN